MTLILYFLAVASGPVVDRGARAGRGETQEEPERGAGWDLGPHARHVGRREADGRQGSAQGHPGRQRLVGQVWSGQGKQLFVIRLINPQCHLLLCSTI